MNKILRKDDTLVTPFIVTKNWELSNVTNEDVILMEHTGSPGLPVGVEYLIFGPNIPVTASACDIALEQQADDLVNYRDGLKVDGLFYPDTDPVNLDGTYQRVVYSQIVNMFYNSYRDPTKIWGLEKIDFDSSQTKRFLADKFKMFEVPQIVYGEKIIPNTVIMYDDTTDNDYVIVDDGNCNLFAGNNLFAHQQELGEYINGFTTGSFNYCSVYDTISIPDQPLLSVYYNSCIPNVDISWNINNWEVSYYVLAKSTDGLNYNIVFNGFGYSYLDTAVSYSGSYWYQIYAVNLLGTSSYTTVSIFAGTSSLWDYSPDNWDDAGFSCSPTYWDS